MTLPTNGSYSNAQRLQYAREILLRALPHQAGDTAWYEGLKDCLLYWNAFVPFPSRNPRTGESEIEYVEALYDQLRPYAFEWLTNHRMVDLEARVEALEQPNGGPLEDYR